MYYIFYKEPEDGQGVSKQRRQYSRYIKAERERRKQIRGGNLWVGVIVKSWVNKQAGSWLATQEWSTNQKPGQQVDPILDSDYNS